MDDIDWEEPSQAEREAVRGVVGSGGEAAGAAGGGAAAGETDAVDAAATVASLTAPAGSLAAVSAPAEVVDDVSETTLAKYFDEARALLAEVENGADAEEGQPKLFAALSRLQSASWLSRVLGIFSSNEEMEDIATSSLRYLLIEYYIATLLDKVRTTERLPLARSTKLNYETFLNRCNELGLVSEADMAMVASNARPTRDRKIQLYREQQTLQGRISQINIMLQKAKTANVEPDDDIVRELEVSNIKTAISIALSTISTCQDELNMLSRMPAGGAAASSSEYGTEADDPRIKHKPVDPFDPNRPGLKLMKIHPCWHVTRETFRAQVFRPGHRLPTMTLEEFAELEMADAAERAKRQSSAEDTRVMKGKELHEAGKEDDEDLADKATVRDRAWDDWLDTHQKGVGRTRRI